MSPWTKVREECGSFRVMLVRSPCRVGRSTAASMTGQAAAFPFRGSSHPNLPVRRAWDSVFTCPALWCRIGSGDQTLPSCLPTISLDALSARECAPISVSVHRNLGASAVELRGGKGSPLSLGASRQRCMWGELFLLSRDTRTSEQTPAREMGLWVQLHRPPGSKEELSAPGLEGPKKPCPHALWKPQQSSIPNGTVTFLLGCTGGLEVFFFCLCTKKVFPSLKKGPFKNDAKLTLLELQGFCWEARSCKNIIE